MRHSVALFSKSLNLRFVPSWKFVNQIPIQEISFLCVKHRNIYSKSKNIPYNLKEAEATEMYIIFINYSYTILYYYYTIIIYTILYIF